MTLPVLIVGAGPVGLTTALVLAQRGVKSILFEKETNPPDDLRASTFHPPTLEMLDTLGLAKPLIQSGLITPNWQIRWHETHEFALFDLGLLSEDTPYPYRLQNEQKNLCAEALAMAKDNPLVEVCLGCEALEVDQNDDNVSIRYREHGEEKTREGSFVIATDGAKSRVRESMGLRLSGTTYPEVTILATTHFPFHDHLPNLSNVNYVWFDGGTFSLLRLPNLWRVSLYPDDGETLESAIQPNSVAKKLDRIVPNAGGFVDEIRPYRIHRRILDDYRHGRVLFAGDAAHLNSPSGGMGMNGGIHDAFCLCDSLLPVLRKQKPIHSLDVYTRKRKPIAQAEILSRSHKNRSRMQERDPTKRREILNHLQRTATNPHLCREFLLGSSMIAGLRRAEEID